jgi:putative salt-induced outer membrane protein YdiY
LSNFRSNSNLTLRREIIDDLFFDLSFFYNYLSDPPAGAENEDSGVITSLGYSF